MKYCSNCGEKIKETSKFCPDCGYEIGKQYMGGEPKERSKRDEEEENNTFQCEHCGKRFTSEVSCLKHEKNCHNKPSPYDWSWTKPDTATHPKLNNTTIILVVIIIVIAAFILMSMYGQQQHANSFSGQTESLIDKIFG